MSGVTYRVNIASREHSVTLLARNGTQMLVRIGDECFNLTVERQQRSRELVERDSNATSRSAGNILVRSPLPGLVRRLLVAPGTRITTGTAILVLEAMKMENQVVAENDGTLSSFEVSVGQEVQSGSVLATIEIESAEPQL